jgi:hypothetical protein
VDRQIRWHGNYFENDGRLLAQPFDKRASYALADAAPLIVTLLLSLGLWAAIWGAVDLLAPAVSR